MCHPLHCTCSQVHYSYNVYYKKKIIINNNYYYIIIIIILLFLHNWSNVINGNQFEKSILDTYKCLLSAE